MNGKNTVTRISAMRRGKRRDLLNYLEIALYVTASVVVAEALLAIDVQRVSAVFLAAVLLSAARFGVAPGLFAAFIAFVSYNVLTVQPRYTLRIDTLDEVLNVMIFFSVAMLTGALAGRAKDEATRARAHADTMTSLFGASRSLSSLAGEPEVRAQIAQLLADAVQGQAEVIYDGLTISATSPGAAPNQTANWTSRELACDDVHLGICRWRTFDPSLRSASLDDYCSLVAELGAAAIMRARSSASIAAGSRLSV